MIDDPPGLVLVSENDELDLRKRELIAALEWPTRELASNLLRVIRGAGKPYDLLEQVMALAVAIQSADELSNPWGMWSEMERVLQSAFKAKFPDDAFWTAEESVIRGSLQIVASRLVDQAPQVNMGERERDEGIREIERMKHRKREEIQASLKPPPRPQRATKRAVKVKPARTVAVAASPKRVATATEPKPVTTADYMSLNAKRRRDGKEPI